MHAMVWKDMARHSLAWHSLAWQGIPVFLLKNQILEGERKMGTPADDEFPAQIAQEMVKTFGGETGNRRERVVTGHV